MPIGVVRTRMSITKQSMHARQDEAHQAKREAAPGLGKSRQLQPLSRKSACCPVIAANGEQDLQVPHHT